MFAGKTMEQSFRKFFITNALDGIKYAILWDSSVLGCPDLKSTLEEYVDSACETGCTSEEDGD
jgi:hypothetical protein